MSGFDLDLGNTWLSVECPACGYEVDLRWIDARLEDRVWCFGCYRPIRLIDETASVELADRSVSRSLDDLQRAFDDLGGTFEIKF